VNTRVSSEVTFIFTTGEKSVGVHADTETQVHQGVSNPGVPKGACFRSIRGHRHRPCKVRAGGDSQSACGMSRSSRQSTAVLVDPQFHSRRNHGLRHPANLWLSLLEVRRGLSN